MDIHEKARAWRVASGLTQTEVASKVSVSQPHYCAFEGGTTLLGPAPAMLLQMLSGGDIRADQCVGPRYVGIVRQLQAKRRAA